MLRSVELCRRNHVLGVGISHGMRIIARHRTRRLTDVVEIEVAAAIGLQPFDPLRVEIVQETPRVLFENRAFGHIRVELESASVRPKESEGIATGIMTRDRGLHRRRQFNADEEFGLTPDELFNGFHVRSTLKRRQLSFLLVLTHPLGHSERFGNRVERFVVTITQQ